MAAMLPLGDETPHAAMLAKPFTASDSSMRCWCRLRPLGRAEGTPDGNAQP